VGIMVNRQCGADYCVIPILFPAINTFGDGSMSVSSGGTSGIQEISSSNLNTNAGLNALNTINGTAVAAQNNMTISGGLKATDATGNTCMIMIGQIYSNVVRW
jgi:hypothetical protein